MSTVVTLRPLKPEERPWFERNAMAVSWLWFGTIVALSFVMIPDYPAKALAGDRHYLRIVLQVGLVAVVMLYATYITPKTLAKLQRQLLVITDNDITLKERSSGVSPERVIWRMRKEEIGSVQPRAVGKHSQFILMRNISSPVRRFFQWAGIQDGRAVQARSWVTLERKDAKEKPPLPAYRGVATRKKMIEDLRASDLGQALTACGYIDKD
jgi:hypothetical protein